MDRDRYSKTYGSFDRLYWGWKLKDFSDLTLQRLVYPCTKILMLQNNLDDSHLEYIVAAFNFTIKSVHQDGSIDQAFYGEHSHAGTGFLLFDLVNTYELIRDLIDSHDRKNIENLLRHMADYLLKHDETHGFISNHLLGVAASLIKMYTFFDDKIYFDKAYLYINSVLENQSSEGWLLEYNGADPGYQTLGIYYLAYIYKLTNDSMIREPLFKAIEFVAYFIHPDGSFGGEYGSRNTEIFYPGGIALLLDEMMPLHHSMITFMRESIENHKTVTLDAIDVGNLAPLINNFLLLQEAEVDENLSTLLPFNKVFKKVLNEMGVYLFSNQRYYSIVSMNKGGIVKSFSKLSGQKVLDHCGYVLQQNNKIYTTQLHKNNRYVMNGNTMTIDVGFYAHEQPIPTALNFVLLKLFFLIVQRSYYVREIGKKLLAKLMLKKQPKIFKTVQIMVEFNEDETSVFMTSTDKNRILQIDGSYKFSTVHMASSKYYV